MYHLSFFCQAEDGIRDIGVTGVQTCALPIVFPVCLLRAILTTVSCYVVAVWICLGLRLNEGEQVFMHLLALFRSSWEKSLCPTLGQGFIGLFFFLWRRVRRLYLWASHPLSDVCFANIHSQLLCCLCIESMVSLTGQTRLHLSGPVCFLSPLLPLPSQTGSFQIGGSHRWQRALCLGLLRSEERRVGKERRSRWSPDH